jgi:ribose 5-phosphate isomerase B
MKIAIGADHRGFELKEFLKKQMSSIEWLDVGAFDTERSDYPTFAHEVAHKIMSGDVTHGILICGSGVGIAMAANRHQGIFAGVVWNDEVARAAKSHDNINVLVIPSDFVSAQEALRFVRIWLETKFKEGRYQERLDMIERM